MGHSMSKVSIIIPAFNQGRYLAQAIESALNQTHKDLEVVVVDDGSTDNTSDIAANYIPDSRFQFIRQPNRGVGAARNRGIEESSGVYLTFLDSDDYFHPEKVEKQAQIMDENDSLGFVYCDIITVDGESTPVATQYSVGAVRRELSGNIFNSLMLGGYFPPHTVMVRRSALLSAGIFDLELGGHADYDLWLRLAGRGETAYYLDKKLAYYRQSPNSMSQDSAHMTATRLAALRKNVALFPGKVAEGLHHVIQLNSDLDKGNRWLNEKWREMLAVNQEISSHNQELCSQLESLRNIHEPIKTITGPKLRNLLNQQIPASAVEVMLLLDRFPERQMLQGELSQAAIWEASIHGQGGRCLFLQPPSRVRFSISLAGEGQLAFSIALHPEIWDKVDAGTSIFKISIDNRINLHASLNPKQNVEDRQWHDYLLNFPATPQGAHEIVFESRVTGGSDSFRWVLWLEPQIFIINQSV
jgi:glycosyltransferase involved in cell wall biosynthesis